MRYTIETVLDELLRTYTSKLYQTKCNVVYQHVFNSYEAKQQRTGSMSFKVSDKGGVSIYGLGRFPVTHYYEQWIKLLDRAQDLRDFLEENKSKLKLKE